MQYWTMTRSIKPSQIFFQNVINGNLGACKNFYLIYRRRNNDAQISLTYKLRNINNTSVSF